MSAAHLDNALPPPSHHSLPPHPLRCCCLFVCIPLGSLYTPHIHPIATITPPPTSPASLSDIDYQIVIIDDSPVGDPTYEVAKKLQTLYGKDRVEILKRTQKLGLASAYMTGIDLADGDFVIILDADMSHHVSAELSSLHPVGKGVLMPLHTHSRDYTQPKFIPDMIAKQKEGDYDVVSGTRYRYGGGIYGWSMFRKLTSRVANFLATTLLSPNASDLTGSFRYTFDPAPHSAALTHTHALYRRATQPVQA